MNNKSKIKDYLRKKLSLKSIQKLRNLLHDTMAIGHGNDLDKLGKIYRTDKVGIHFYTAHYKLHFSKFKFKKINLLEIGAGGYEWPYNGGNSLRMWKKYFPYGKIFSIDIFDKSALEENRIKIYKGSQIDKPFLEAVANEIEKIDIIIDDGSHENEHVIESFKLLFPRLADEGIYVVEDTQTSYWPELGGDSNELNNPNTMMNYFKGLTDSMNNKEYIRPGYIQNYFDKKIISMHFYHNLIFIYKGNNDEESNVIINNQKLS